MTEGVGSPKLNKGPPLIPDDVKKDIPDNPGKPGAPGTDAAIVKAVPKNDIFRPKLELLNVKRRKATLRPQKPRMRKPIDGGADRNISPVNIDFKLPPKPAIEKHGGRLMTSTTVTSTAVGGGGTAVVLTTVASTFSAKIGVAVGAAAGSVVPVVGTAIGAVTGLVVGALVGYLVLKFGRSHSERRYIENAKKSLEKRGVKFTKKEKKRLEAMRPEQWRYLAKNNKHTIKGLKRHCELLFRDKRWAKQFYYQYAAMAVAKYGYAGAQRRLHSLNRDAKQTDAPEIFVPGKMYAAMGNWGADAFGERRSAYTGEHVSILDTHISLQKQKWDALTKNVEEQFGEAGANHFNNRYRRYIQTASRADQAQEAFDAATKLQTDLKAFLQDYIGQYDQAVQDRVFKLVDKYALDLAVDDVPKESFYDAHGNFDTELISELINTAARLQDIKDSEKSLSGGKKRDRTPADVAVRRATLPNRISGLPAACGRNPYAWYLRFITDGADNGDFYDNCAQLLKIPENQLAKNLGPTDKARKTPTSAPTQALVKALAQAKIQAKDLRAMAGLAGRLKDAGVAPATARMILRMEARARVRAQVKAKKALKEAEKALEEAEKASKEAKKALEEPKKALEEAKKALEDFKVVNGWSPALNPEADANQPTEDLMDRAREAAAFAEKLHLALKDDPEFERLTAGDAEHAYFRVLAAHEDPLYKDHKPLARLRENDFSDMKKILRSDVSIHWAYRYLLEGAGSLDKAIECTRLRVKPKALATVKKIDKRELKQWREKGFSDVEIAAYRGNLKIWDVDHSKKPPKVFEKGRLPISDDRMGYFCKSNLTVDEANDFLALDLVPPHPETAPDVPATKLRHHMYSQVLLDEPGGKGANSEVRRRTIRKYDGSIDRRVFKPIPLSLDYNKLSYMTRRVGANLAASTLNEQLGFSAIVHTQMSTRNGQVGVSMELAKGHTPHRLLNGEVFLTVPKNFPRYKALHKAVEEDMKAHGAISEETRAYAAKELGFTRLRMAGQELQAAGDFMTDLTNDPEFQRMMVELQIIDFVNDELDRHLNNLLIDVQLGPKGVTAVAVKGIDNDGGFAADDYYPNSIRTAPRVISRRQADAIIKAYEGWTDKKDGARAKLYSLVPKSTIHKPIKPDIGFPLAHSRNATAAHLPPPKDGDQVYQAEQRLKMLYDRVKAAESGTSELEPDNFSTLTIISDPRPENDMNEQKKDVKDDVEVNFGIKLNLGRESDKDETWGSKLATDILTQTSSLVARHEMRLN